MRRRPVRVRDDGFALVEYIITIAITALIVGTLAAALIVVFRNQSAAVTRHDEANGSLGLTNYFPMDVASTPPGGRETSPGLDTGCGAYSDSGFNVLRLTWTETLTGSPTTFRVSYRLVETTTGGELRRVECRNIGQGFGAAKSLRVAFGLKHVNPTWTTGSVPAVLSPLTGDGNLTLTLTSIAGNVYSVQGSRFNPASYLDPYVEPAPNVSLTATMSLTTPNYSVAGQVLTYNVTLSNSGAVPLTAVLPVYSNATAGIACATVLAPGVTTSCTATHVVTQQDLDDGTVTASLAAIGYYSVYVAGAVAVNTIPAAAAPGLSAVLSTTSQGYRMDNAAINSTMTVTNTGNITVTALTPSYSNASIVSDCTPLPIAPGASATCALTHTVTAAEYTDPVSTTGTIVGATTNFGNTAAVTTPPLTVAFLPEAKLTVSAVSASPAIYSAAGDLITVSVTVANTGNVDIGSLQVVYNKSVSNQQCASSVVRNLSVTCTARYQVTQDDVDDRSVSITATASGSWKSYSTTASATTYAYTSGYPAISLLMTSTKDTYTTVGEVIPFTLRVTNVGTVTLTSISPTYPNAVSSGSCTPLPLAPGATATCNASHTVTSGELGSNISASASAYAGTTNAGNTSTATASAVVVNFLPAPQIAVSSYVASPSPFTSIGQSVTFTVTIANTGNVALSNVALTYTNAASSTTCPSTLAIGATATCRSTHTTTTADAASNFAASAKVTALYNSTSVSSTASTTVPSAVPCTVLTSNTATIGNPTSVSRVATGTYKNYLSSDVVITLQSTALCSGLRIKYYTSNSSAVTADMTASSSGNWTFTIPGQGSAGSTAWGSKGSVQIDVLPPASVGSTAIYTNTAAFTVST